MDCFKISSRIYIYNFFRKPLIVSLLLNLNISFAQQDTLQLNTGETIIGELKEMKRNQAIVETDFTENDLKIKWDKIKRLKTTTEFLITLKSGERYTGNLNSIDDEIVALTNKDEASKEVKIQDIVYIRQIKNQFIDRLDASLSVGYNFTKANNLSQYTVRSNLGYKAKRWSVTTRYNQIISTQDDIDKTQRLDANLVYNRFLKKNWFILGEVNWLSNTAQNIDLRTLGKFGVGKYIIQTNSLYWGLQTGI